MVELPEIVALHHINEKLPINGPQVVDLTSPRHTRWTHDVVMKSMLAALWPGQPLERDPYVSLASPSLSGAPNPFSHSVSAGKTWDSFWAQLHELEKGQSGATTGKRGLAKKLARNVSDILRNIWLDTRATWEAKKIHDDLISNSSMNRDSAKAEIIAAAREAYAAGKVLRSRYSKLLDK